ncbi:MAG: hypothetical protein R2724_05710 [Bryobacterales bacterium]
MTARSPSSPDVNSIFLQKDFTAYQTGAYLQTSRNLTNRLNLTWGGRLDHYQL